MNNGDPQASPFATTAFSSMNLGIGDIMMLKKWTSIGGVMIAVAVSSTALASAPIKLNCSAGTTQVGGTKAKPDMVACMKPGGTNGHTPHGPMVMLYPDGAKEAEGQAENGFRSGLWTFYDESGRKTGTAMFKGGNFHGEVVEFHANGKVRKVENYVNGLREGTAKEFSDDGKLVKQTEYRANHVVLADK